MRRTNIVGWGYALLAIFVISAPFEGYTALPGMAGHSIFSLIARPVVLILPFVIAWQFLTGPRPLWGLLVVLGAWLSVVAATYWWVSPHTYYDAYYLWSQAGGVALVGALWILAHKRTVFVPTVSLGLFLYTVATIVVGLWEVKTGHHLGPARTNGHIPTTFYFDPNSLGAAIALTVPYIALLWMGKPRRTITALSLLALVPLLYLLYKTGSRGGYIALWLSVMTAPWILPVPYRRAAWWTLASLTGLGIAVVVWLHNLPHNVPLPFALQKLKHLSDIFTRLHVTQAHSKPTSLSIRVALLRAGWQAVQHHPWGLGPRGAERWFAHQTTYNTYGVIDAHNMWLENAIDFGWLGVTLLVLWYGWILTRAFRLSRNGSTPWIRYVGAASAASLTGFIVGSVSPSSVMVGFHLMWVVFGTVVGAVVIDQQRPQRYPFKKSSVLPTPHT